MTLENPHFLIGNLYIFIHGWFSMVMLVNSRGVSEMFCTCSEVTKKATGLSNLMGQKKHRETHGFFF